MHNYVEINANIGPSLHSNVCDLKSKKIYLYLNHNFNDVVEIDLLEELKKGEKSYLISTYMALMYSPDIYPEGTVVLLQNYPNPFNQTTTIPFTIDRENYMTLKIYDIIGREKIVLLSKNIRPGAYSVDFNGASLPRGHYIYAIETKRFRMTRKMTVKKY